MSDFIEQEAKQVALIVVLAQRILDRTAELTEYQHGPDKAEETRKAQYTAIMQMQGAINGLLALHQESARKEQGGNLNA
jgi:hypothetical protein